MIIIGTNYKIKNQQTGERFPLPVCRKNKKPNRQLYRKRQKSGMGEYLPKVRLRALTQKIDRKERQIKILPFFMSNLYKNTYIVLTFKNFSVIIM